MLAIADKLQQNAKLCNFVYIDWIWLKKHYFYVERGDDIQEIESKRE